MAKKKPAAKKATTKKTTTKKTTVKKKPATKKAAAKKIKMNSHDSTDANTERPNIAEKVRFWEEQDKINQALIPRVKELHEIVTDLHKRTSNISSQIAEAEARVLQKVQEQNEQRFKQVQSQIQKMQGQNKQVKHQAGQKQDNGDCVSLIALVLSVLALGLSIYQWFA